MIFTSMRYNLYNSGGTQLTWRVAPRANWLVALPLTGSLASLTIMSVNITTNTSASFLPAGSYTSSVDFVNVTTGAGSTTRNVTLDNKFGNWIWGFGRDTNN